MAATEAPQKVHGQQAAPAQLVLSRAEGDTARAHRAWGRSIRDAVPREGLAAVVAAGKRPDPVAILEEQGRTRVQELLPLRHTRMLASPFAFLRGSAAVMASDLARTPSTGIEVQLCGDAHIANFGLFATPERNLVFDLNDFDETHAGPFEWDLKRLAVSVVVAARDRGFDRAIARRAARASIEAYQAGIHDMSGMPFLEAWYQRVDVTDIFSALKAQSRGGRQRRAVTRAARRLASEARARTSIGSLDKLARQEDGIWRIRERPPLVTRYGLTDEVRASIRQLFEGYASSLRPELHVLLSSYRFVDFARKVVGVGSVGTEAFIFLLVSGRERDVLFLQLKQAQASVIAPWVSGPAVVLADGIEHDGQRVVVGQRLMQAASDQFLGWASGGPRESQHFYLRQLRDMKVSADLTAMAPDSFTRYASLCGRVLAFSHARSGSASAIAGYIGKGRGFGEALTAFAEAYADRTAEDHAALQAAASSGRIAVAGDEGSAGTID
ncbi:MAG TPA: DUF2252 domain-containing protein [Anaerolineae bacterium]|nr:DUF2252 domain-containing protein [Anaerolineae bacterium]